MLCFMGTAWPLLPQTRGPHWYIQVVSKAACNSVHAAPWTPLSSAPVPAGIGGHSGQDSGVVAVREPTGDAWRGQMGTGGSVLPVRAS